MTEPPPVMTPSPVKALGLPVGRLTLPVTAMPKPFLISSLRFRKASATLEESRRSPAALGWTEPSLPISRGSPPPSPARPPQPRGRRRGRPHSSSAGGEAICPAAPDAVVAARGEGAAAAPLVHHRRQGALLRLPVVRPAAVLVPQAIALVLAGARAAEG